MLNYLIQFPGITITAIVPDVFKKSDVIRHVMIHLNEELNRAVHEEKNSFENRAPKISTYFKNSPLP